MQDFFSFLKVFAGLLLLAVAFYVGLSMGGIPGAILGGLLWWLLAALADQ